MIDLGIVELDLNFATSDRLDNGNLVGLISGYTTQDGQTHEMADVWFQRSRDAAPPPELDELLAAAPPAVEPPAQVSGVSSSAPPPDPLPPAGPSSTPGDDELRQVCPLI